MEGMISEIKLEKLEVEICAESSEYSKGIMQSTKDVPLLLRCRLCALPNDDMVDIFSPNETEKDILEHITYCLRIVVKESDTLPRQACRACLEELELCYQFNKIVVEAEEQLLALDRKTSGKLEELERNYQSSLECTAAVHPNGVKTQDNKPPTIVEQGLVLDATVNTDFTVLAVLQPSTGVWLPLKTNGAAILTTDQNGKAESKHENPESSMNELDFGGISVPLISQQSTCNLEENNTSKSRLQAEEKETLRPHSGKKLKNLRIKQEDLVVPGEPGTKEFKCHMCSKTYTRKASLTRHRKFHTGKGLHKCNYCEKKFSTGSERDRHHLIHTSVGRYKCLICQETLSSLSVLKDHAATVHSDVKNYPFSLCKQIPCNRLTTKRNRQTSIHSGERLLWCQYCQKDFRGKEHLQNHLKNCKTRRLTKNRATLTMHNKIHVGDGLYNCEYCEKKFITRFSRDRHRHVHTIKKPFKCSICEETFAWIESLYNHTAIHTVSE